MTLQQRKKELEQKIEALTEKRKGNIPSYEHLELASEIGLLKSELKDVEKQLVPEHVKKICHDVAVALTR